MNVGFHAVVVMHHVYRMSWAMLCGDVLDFFVDVRVDHLLPGFFGRSFFVFVGAAFRLGFQFIGLSTFARFTHLRRFFVLGVFAVGSIGPELTRLTPTLFCRESHDSTLLASDYWRKICYCLVFSASRSICCWRSCSAWISAHVIPPPSATGINGGRSFLGANMPPIGDARGRSTSS